MNLVVYGGVVFYTDVHVAIHCIRLLSLTAGNIKASCMSYTLSLFAQL